MGVYHDRIAAEVAAREGLIASAGVGKIHLLPMRDRSLIQARTRNIRRIRCEAAAALGVLPSQVVQADPDGKGLRDFRIDFHKPNTWGWGFLDRAARYGIFASAFDLSAEKYFVVGAAHKERFRNNAAPTGRRTDKVIGTDELGDPVYEIVEDVQGAVISHLRQQIARHIRPFTVDSPEGRALPEFGSTVDTVFPDLDGWHRHTATNQTFTTIRNGAGNSSNANGAAIGLNAGTTSSRFDYMDRAALRFDLSAYPSTDSASLSIYPYALLTTLGAVTIHAVPTTAPTTGAIIDADYALAKYTMETKGSLASGDTTTGAYNQIALDASVLTLGGTTRVGLVCDFDLNNSAPTWSSNGWSAIVFYLTAQAGTDKDPYLELTTAAAPAASGTSLALRMALGLV